jgi:hypothetical protein
VNRYESPKERRRSGGSGRWSPDPKAQSVRKSLVGPWQIHPNLTQDQGGPAEKANYPQPIRLLATPRCGFGHSGEDVKDPEGPANSREAVSAFGQRLPCLLRKTL